MKVQNIQYSIKDKKALLSAELSVANGRKHIVYFEVDEKFKDFIAKDASPFLAASLAIAMKKNQTLDVDGVVSKRLLSNTSGIIKILQGWNLGFEEISLSDRSVKQDAVESDNIGLFFSGGVDSFYTYIKNKKKINYLIFVHGFDINVNDIALYQKIEKNILHIAKEENIEVIKAKTNIREMFEQYFDWNAANVFAIGSVALFLRRGFKEIYASCGMANKRNKKHGFTSPELDSLWSTESMRLVHYGCNADKISKLKFLSSYRLVMENLRVCWVNKNRQYNCCECEKCFRNMLALYVSHSLSKCKTFKKGLDLERLKTSRFNKNCLEYFIAVLEALKLKNDTSEVRFALEASIQNSKFPKFPQNIQDSVKGFIRLLDNKYNRNRLFWFFARRGLIRS